MNKPLFAIAAMIFSVGVGAQTAGAGAQMNAAMQKVHTVDGVKAVRDHIKIAPAS